MPPLMGLSPYTRGTPFLLGFYWKPWGSIPVHTGNTNPVAHIFTRVRVYPRTHGEHNRIPFHRFPGVGLSPYTRGTQIGRKLAAVSFGSIPVHTGNTGDTGMIGLEPRVYPRTHGEHIASIASAPNIPGLSPYTRGTPNEIAHQHGSWGSIPVHTGNTLSSNLLKFNKSCNIHPSCCL